MAHEYSLKQVKNHTRTMFNSFIPKRLNCFHVSASHHLSRVTRQNADGQTASLRREPRAGLSLEKVRVYICKLVSGSPCPLYLSVLSCLC